MAKLAIGLGFSLGTWYLVMDILAKLTVHKLNQWQALLDTLPY